MEFVTANRSNILKRKKSVKSISCRRKTSKSNSQEARQCSFLNFRFETLPIFDMLPTSLVDCRVEKGEHQLYLAKEKIAIDSNLIKLRKAAEAYCKTNGGSLPVSLNDHPLRQLQELYFAIDKCKPKGNSIGIDYDHKNNELVFYEFAHCDYPQCCVAFIQTKVLDILPEPYRQFVKEVMSLTRATMQIPTVYEHFDFGYALGEWGEEFVDELIEENEELSEMITSYKEGHALELITEVSKTPWHFLTLHNKQTEERFNRLYNEAPTSELQMLVGVCLEGIELMENECIGSYRNVTTHCEIPEFDVDIDDEVLPLERITAVCYGDETDDPVVDFTINQLNNDGCNYPQEELYQMKEINEFYDKPLTSTNFPQKWFDWFAQFNQAIWRYEQARKDDE